MEIEVININCPNCGVLFCIAKGHKDQLKDTGDTFYCPNGHSQIFGNSSQMEIKKLKKSLKYDQEYQQRLRDSVTGLEYQNRALKGHQTRLKNKLNQL